MERVVVDTNVLVSAALNPDSVPAQVVAAAFTERFELVLSPKLVAELAGVLRRPKFTSLVTPAQVDAFVEALEEVALPVDDPDVADTLLRDPDDDYLVALAVSSGASMLVSGDGDLLAAEWMPVRVLSPRAFVAEIAAW